ncbi:MAG: sigma-70 family RNA polymerase sigma factor [Clostridiales bacterium]|nr:sigma-70 family RNA polymerase sigma factor [Clostridiales bacterium]
MINKKGITTGDERELIKKAKGGDEGSFEALISTCKGRAYNVALRYMASEEDALDALQESFIKIFRHLDKFNEQSKFETWVYKIVVNSCNDMLRRSKKNQQSDSVFKYDDGEEAAIEVADRSPGPAEILERKEEGAYILSCLDRVGIEHKEILILRDIQGFSYDEISEMLDCPVGTVKSKISRARLKLKELYLQNQEQIKH